MAGETRVDAVTLHTAAKDIREARTDIEGELRTLWDVIDDLAAAWKGGASLGFQRLMERWDGDCKRLLVSMGNIADLLDKSGTTHTTNDEQQQELLNKFNAALGG